MLPNATNQQKSTAELNYDTRQEKNYFITKVIDIRTKIKQNCCRGGGLNLCTLTAQCVSKAKNGKTPTTLTPQPRCSIVNREL